MTQEIAQATDFQTIDTTVIQVRSVLNFMYALGYVLDANSKTARFFTENKSLQANRFLSVHTAIRMHNMPDEGWNVLHDGQGNATAHPHGVNLKGGFTVLGVRDRKSTRLVPKVKFSVTRVGVVVIQDHMVRPLNET